MPFRRSIPRASLVLLAGDIFLAAIILYSVSLAGNGFLNPLDVRDGLSISFWLIVLAFNAYLFELYVPEVNYDAKHIFRRVTKSLFVSFVVFATISFLLPQFIFGRLTLFSALLFFGVGQFGWHVLFARFTYAPEFSQRILVVGTGRLARKIGNLINSRNHKYYFVGFVECGSEGRVISDEEIVGSSAMICSIAEQKNANKIVVAVSDRRGRIPVKELLECKMSGIDVMDAATFFEMMNGKLMIDHLVPSALIYSDGFRVNHTRKFFKRIVDICCALGLLVIVLPLLPLIALLVKLDSSGPVLFGQKRVGEGARQFIVLKFRTMRTDAEKLSGAVWAKKDDPRCTRVGRFLRKSRLDELPQLWNVLRGEMSFVGPRPERPEFVNELANAIPYYAKRHTVKPGITGWAQVSYAYGASVEDAYEKLSYDLYYIKHISVLFDMMIVLQTIRVVLFGRGSR
ncbi:MAG TPA: TIGR03013 family XrtA/PEP-CTERM system glycosyltransferase [Dissulfurispiraceae bacterium]|nr:TIGR03013 family XrtA/PEP-CTERM system glycosyltransferase [Dissulfurispiraceae bacterium]